MKTLSLSAILAALILCGCAEEQPVIAYHQPLTSPGGIFANLPPAVQNSVRAEAGMAEIQWIYKNHLPSGNTVYEVHFKNHDVFPPLYLASDGSVLNPDLTVSVGATQDTIEAATGVSVGRLRMEDLPQAVVLTVRHSAPTAEVDTITRLNSGTEIFYEFTFKGPQQHPNLLVRDDGHIML